MSRWDSTSMSSVVVTRGRAASTAAAKRAPSLGAADCPDCPSRVAWPETSWSCEGVCRPKACESACVKSRAQCGQRSSSVSSMRHLLIACKPAVPVASPNSPYTHGVEKTPQRPQRPLGCWCALLCLALCGASQDGPNKEATSQLGLEPGGLGRHDTLLVRHGHHVGYWCCPQRKG